MRERAEIGVTGLATMGRNLARNMARHGWTVAVHNRTTSRVDDLIRDHGDEGRFVPATSIEDFLEALERPRRILAMVAAGRGTEEVLDRLLPHLEPGDVVIDGGNAHFEDTRRRHDRLHASGLDFVGAGVSGGEEGALMGPSIMPGCSEDAYERVGPMLETIAAHADGVPCCTRVGPDGSGHFVKMVHNGIEYADLQLIAESYDLLRQGLALAPADLAAIFRQWNEGDLESYLIATAATVLDQGDPRTGAPLVDVVADQAEEKGTGRWTVASALELGVPVTGIAEAVFARSLSAHPVQRHAAQALPGPAGATRRLHGAAADRLVDDVRQALYASKVVAYAQGFDQLAAGSAVYGWGVDLGAMATIWRGGCIIRARFLDRIRVAYERDPHLATLLVDDHFADALGTAQDAWRRVVGTAATLGVPAPGFSSALAYYDALRRERLPAALIQSLRDFFGAHGYRRMDDSGAFHLDWSGDRSETPW